MQYLNTLNQYILDLFDVNNFARIDTINGIQVEKSNTPIKKIAYAVDSSLPIIKEAATQDADILLVHHGLYWGFVEPITHTMFQKTQALLQADMALYALHLPLDAHPIYGNNAQLAQRLQLTNLAPFGTYKHTHIGVQGNYDTPLSFTQIQDLLFAQNKYNNTSIPIISVENKIPHNTMPHFNPLGQYVHDANQIKKVAIISGGGLKQIDEAYTNTIDLYITGDANHTAYLQAQSLGINVLFAGHYFTEVWGVLALATHIQEKFDIEGVFIDDPTGL